MEIEEYPLKKLKNLYRSRFFEELVYSLTNLGQGRIKKIRLLSGASRRGWICAYYSCLVLPPEIDSILEGKGHLAVYLYYI